MWVASWRSWNELRHYHLHQCFLGNVSTGCADLPSKWNDCLGDAIWVDTAVLNFSSHSLLNIGMVSQGQECLPATKPWVFQLHLILLLTLHSTLFGRNHRSSFKRSEVSGFETSIQLRWLPFLSRVQSCRIRVTPTNLRWDWTMVKGSKKYLNPYASHQYVADL